MKQIIIDFETYSDVDIEKRGLYNYAQSATTEILCMGYKIDNNPTKLIAVTASINRELMSEIQDIAINQHDLRDVILFDESPGDLFTAFTNPNVKIYAHNAGFEYEIILNHHEQIMFLNEGLTDASRFIDTMALCLRNRLPASLEKACEALNCEFKKNKDGTRLIKKCCTPKQTATAEDFFKLYQYCIDDINATYSLLNALPADHLTLDEQKVWELTLEMNRTGVFIDTITVESVVKYLDKYTIETQKKLPELTNGLVTTPGQRAKILQFCSDNGVELPNLQAETVDNILDIGGLPENVEEVLKIRKLLGRSSVAKYVALKELNNNGIVQGNLLYHGGGTGRWAGMAFKYDNLPRDAFKSEEEIDFAISAFRDGRPINDPVGAAKKLIRPMIIAPPGKSLLVADFSSIENRVLAWISDDFESLKLFEKGLSQYIDMAAYIYNTDYDKIQKGTKEYQLGKALILGCGYQMGGHRFVSAATQHGINVNVEQAKNLVNVYRAKYYLVAQTWGDFSTVSKLAVRNPGYVYESHKCSFVCVTDRNGKQWLRIVLPSGRALMYYLPRIDSGKHGHEVTYYNYSSKYHKMLRTALTPGLITENIVQAIARDLLVSGAFSVLNNMPYVTPSIFVHDEMGVYIDDKDIDDDTLNTFCDHMCLLPDWAEGLPLKAEGYIAKRYRKD